MSKPATNRVSPEVRSRAVRMVFDHQAEHASQWTAIQSSAGKIGCTGETLRSWVQQAERDQGLRGGSRRRVGLNRLTAIDAMGARTTLRSLRLAPSTKTPSGTP